MKTTLPPDYFEDVYRNSEDPWGFETSPYEREKYKDTIRALPKPMYENALEIGCSIGVLTAMLAPHCTKLLSTDINETALQKARQRLQSSPNVKFQLAAIPEEYPGGSFDLVMMSEVGYYLSKDDLAKAKEKIISSLQPGGNLVMVHWTPFVPDYPQTGDEVHDLFMQPDVRLQHIHGNREEKYRMDVFRKV